MDQIRISTAQESTLQASKWLYVQALLSAEEMGALFESLGSFYLALGGTVSPIGKGIVSPADFLDHYKTYVDTLASGELPNPTTYQSVFSSVMTTTLDALYAIPAGANQQLIRIGKPVIQMQTSNIGYSVEDKKFRSMVFGTQNIRWGVQFGYPQLFQDPSTKDVITIRHSDDFPNTELFHSLQKWVRQHTIPTPFVVDGVLTNVPMRLGKQCQSWINRHPQLIEKGITIKN